VLKDTDKDKHYIFDDLGMGASMYFKILKALIRLFMVIIVIYTPLFYLYSCGANMDKDNSSLFISTTLGNLGGSQLECNENNMRLFDFIKLSCSDGTKISHLQKFGL
jgi:hypothetical protein